MNKEQLLEQIEINKREILRLESVIQQRERDIGTWIPIDGEVFFYIDEQGCVESHKYDDDYNSLITCGNFYKTEEDAYFASEFVSVTMRLCFAAFSVDNDAGEWSETRIHTVTKDKDGWYSYVSYNGTEKICVNSTVQSEKMAAIMNSFMGIE